MTKAKFIKSVILFFVVSQGMIIGLPKLLVKTSVPGILDVYQNVFKPSYCYSLGVVFAVAYLILSFRNKKFSEEELAKKKEEYFYAHFTDEQKATVDKMTYDAKTSFYKEYENVLQEEKKKELDQHVFEWTHGTIPENMLWIRKAAQLILACAIAYSGFNFYNTGCKEVIDVYLAEKSIRVDDGMYDVEGLPPVLLTVSRGDSRARKVDYDYMVKFIKETQSPYLLNYCQLIKIQDGERYRSKAPEGSYAYASSEDMSITLQYGSSSLSEETLTHELAHILDFVYAYSSSKDIQDLYHNHAHDVSDYAATEYVEFFAECMKRYVWDNEQFQLDAPETYAYMDANFRNVYETSGINRW